MGEIRYEEDRDVETAYIISVRPITPFLRAPVRLGFYILLNSRSEFSKTTHMPFAHLKVFWNYLDSVTRNPLREGESKSTLGGDGEARAIRAEVNAYPLCGPLAQLRF